MKKRILTVVLVFAVMIQLPWPVLRAIEGNAVNTEIQTQEEGQNPLSGDATDSQVNAEITFPPSDVNAAQTGSENPSDAPAAVDVGNPTGTDGENQPGTSDISTPQAPSESSPQTGTENQPGMPTVPEAENPADGGSDMAPSESPLKPSAEVPADSVENRNASDAAGIPVNEADVMDAGNTGVTTDETEMGTEEESDLGGADELTGDELLEMNVAPYGLLADDGNSGSVFVVSDNFQTVTPLGGTPTTTQTYEGQSDIIYVLEGENSQFTIVRNRINGQDNCWWRWIDYMGNDQIRAVVNGSYVPMTKETYAGHFYYKGGDYSDTNTATITIYQSAHAGEFGVIGSYRGTRGTSEKRYDVHGVQDKYRTAYRIGSMEECRVTIYVVKPIKVTYWMNDGTGTQTPVAGIGQNLPGITLGYTTGTETTSQKMSVSTVIPEREGYRFAGWSTDPGAQEADEKFKNSYQTTEDLDLYAVWKPITGTYSVQYYLENEKGEMIPDGEPEKRNGTTGDKDFYQADKYSDYSVSEVKQGNHTNLGCLMITGDSTPTVEVYYSRMEKEYKVKYWFENLQGSYIRDNTIMEDKTGYGKFGTGIAIDGYKDAPAGFVFDKADPDSAVIGQDGKTEINIYYKRLSYPVHWNVTISDKPNDHSLDRTEIYRYEEKITPPEITAPFGYLWSGWPADVEKEMPPLAEGSTLEYTARLEKTVGDLVITKNWGSNDSTAIYTIDSADGTYTKEVMISGQKSVTVKGLPAGSYIVREQSWSWNGTHEIKAEVMKNGSVTVAFDSAGTNTSWLYGESVGRLASVLQAAGKGGMTDE